MEAEPTVDNPSMPMTKAQITSATVIDREDLEGHEFGFAIHVNDGRTPTWYLRAESMREKKSWLMRLAHAHAIVRWLDDYEKVRVLGVGGTGIVYELLHKSNGQRFAMKEMEIKSKAQMKMAVSEAEMLKDIQENLSHPNIMHIEKVFQVGSKFYLVFPLCTGGELYEHVVRRGLFTEQDASVIMRDLVSGLHALHERDILHLDIKPENILFESEDADARIKITDFGLSRVFSPDEMNSRLPSLAEMEEKLQQFSDSGVLNRDRLRGTIGYMAPELILTGCSSKGADVFAAGVVLYILLCGHPPFQSKSNREVLERTCRGNYSMSDSSWDYVSDDAKDLIKRMLVVDPAARIGTTEILAHPWFTPAQARPGEGATPDALQESHTRPQRTLSSAVRLLTSHVQERRGEKLATTFTRLVSAMGSGNQGKSVLMSYVLNSAGKQSSSSSESSASAAQTASQEMLMSFMDPDIRDAFMAVFQTHGEGGKLSMEQFICVIRYLMGSAPGAVSSAASASSAAQPPSQPGFGLPALLLCKFIDRDGDGMISADDLFTSQALMMQKSEVFLRAIFRVYTEAIWYPGRQLNLMNLQRSAGTPAKRRSGNGGQKVLDENLRANVVEPPKFITGKHVAAIFEKLGFGAVAGSKVFSILREALDKRRGRMSDDEEDLESHRHSISTTPSGTNAALAEALGLDDAGDDDEEAREATRKTFDARVRTAKSSSDRPMSTGRVVMTTPPRDVLEAGKESSGGDGQGGGGGSSAGSKMSLSEFVEAVGVDDVLVQVLFLKLRTGLKDIMKKAETQQRNRAVASLLEIDDTSTAGSPVRRRPSLASVQIYSVLEAELHEALRQGLGPQGLGNSKIADIISRAVEGIVITAQGLGGMGQEFTDNDSASPAEGY